jgi:MoxR-like ATPase
MDSQKFEAAVSTIHQLKSGVEAVIKGKSETIKLLLTALIADGHVLLEDYPGSGKTTLTKTLGSLISKDQSSLEEIAAYRRIQFTPDMLPGDVLGVNIFEQATGRFRFSAGPVFAQIVLADEINRTSPKVQAAFLECMAEKQVTIDGSTHRLDELFFVIGTQNPIDIAGTYPLPIVQLDRFLLKLPMSYADAATELTILQEAEVIKSNLSQLTPVCSRSEVLAARAVAESVRIHPAIQQAAVAIAQASRKHPATMYGISTRGLIMFQSALRALALVSGRNFVNEDDFRELLPFVFLHRMKFHPGSGKPTELLNEICEPELEKMIRTRLDQET